MVACFFVYEVFLAHMTHIYRWPLLPCPNLGQCDLLSLWYRPNSYLCQKASHLTSNSKIPDVLDILVTPRPHWPTCKEMCHCNLYHVNHQGPMGLFLVHLVCQTWLNHSTSHVSVVRPSVVVRRQQWWHVLPLMDGFEPNMVHMTHMGDLYLQTKI